MKPFNLERAKAGEPVRTRDGRKVRIVCFDMKDVYPIIGVITDDEGDEHEESFTNEGRYSVSDDFLGEDLFMESKKITKFVNVYKHGLTGDLITSGVFNTIEEAKAGAKSGPEGFIYTQKLSWEE